MSLLYFTEAELRCPVTRKVVLAPGFGEKLVALREAWGRPMKVNSCCRCEQHNKFIGGHAHSLHVYDKPYHPTGGTAAIDISIPLAQDKAELAYLALGRGWSVGVARTFLHLDRRVDYTALPQALYNY